MSQVRCVKCQAILNVSTSVRRITCPRCGHVLKDEITTAPKPDDAGTRFKKILAVLVGIGALVGLASCIAHTNHSGSSTPPSRSETVEAGVIASCEDSVRRQLKDPDSAQFSEWKAWTVTSLSKTTTLSYHPENGDRAYSAGGMVNAKNGYGGYTGASLWACDAVVNGAYVDAVANSMDDVQG